MLHLEGKNYFIDSGDKGFTNRQKSVFDQLDAVISSNERDNSTSSISSNTIEIDVQPETVTRKRKRNSETKHLKGQESIFKRPEPPSPIRRTQNIPDFRRNPHKWTKYSLNDVSEDDMSEKSNTAAAMAFLQEVESRRNPKIEEESEGKIVFKRPSKKVVPAKKVIEVSSDDSVEDGTTHFLGSKLVMPEYTVGMKPVKKNKRTGGSKSKPEDTPTQIQLNHLFEDETD